MECRSRILVIDDEPNLRRAVEAGLRQAGFDVDGACDGSQGLERLAERRPDAIVLDINMPGLDGFAMLPLIRRRSDAPILMLTARDAAADKIDALAGGADDYVTKPFDMGELAARINAHLRRRPVRGEQISYEDIVITLRERTATRSGRSLALSSREFDLLGVLMREQGRVFRKSQLLDAVWGPQAEIGTETVDRFISLLRQKVDVPPAEPLIQTVRGVGYVLRRTAVRE